MTRSGADLHPNPTGRHIREEYGHQGTFNPFSELRFSVPTQTVDLEFIFVRSMLIVKTAITHLHWKVYQ